MTPSNLLDEACKLPWRLRSKRLEKLDHVLSLWDAYQHVPEIERRNFLYPGDRARGPLFQSIAVFMAEEALNDCSLQTVHVGLLFWLLARDVVDFRERITAFVLLWATSQKLGGSLSYIYENLTETYPELKDAEFLQLVERDAQLNSLSAVGLTEAKRDNRFIFKQSL